MAQIFTPKAPAIQAPPPPPSADPDAIARAKAAADEERRRAQGRASTYMTAGKGAGLMDQAPVSRQSLIGV